MLVFAARCFHHFAKTIYHSFKWLTRYYTEEDHVHIHPSGYNQASQGNMISEAKRESGLHLGHPADYSFEVCNLNRVVFFRKSLHWSLRTWRHWPIWVWRIKQQKSRSVAHRRAVIDEFESRSKKPHQKTKDFMSGSLTWKTRFFPDGDFRVNLMD